MAACLALGAGQIGQEWVGLGHVYCGDGVVVALDRNWRGKGRAHRCDGCRRVFLKPFA